MTRETHFLLTCTKGHLWHEPILTKKLSPGEHRTCPTCGGSSWIATDAPRVVAPEAHKGKVVALNKNVAAPVHTHTSSPIVIEQATELATNVVTVANTNPTPAQINIGELSEKLRDTIPEELLAIEEGATVTGPIVVKTTPAAPLAAPGEFENVASEILNSD